MNRLKFNLKTAAVLTGLFALVNAWGDVVHRQINADNLIVHVSDESWQPEGFINGTVIPAVYLSDDHITVDGMDDEAAWNRTQEIVVPLDYGNTSEVYLKALYTDEDVFIRVSWADETPDREHHPWTWDAMQGRWVVGSQVEDSVLLSFEAGCEWTPSLLAGYVHDFDGWHWLAARSDPLGQALDLYGNVQDRNTKNLNPDMYRSRVDQDSWHLKFIENSNPDLYADWDQLDRVYMLQPVTETVYISGVPDGRGPVQFVEQLDAPDDVPADRSQTFPQYSPVRLEGGAGEVSAKGQWKDGFWTVEFRRVRETPANTLNDTVFQRLTQFSVHVFDSTERVDESAESGRLFLQFLPEKRRRITRN